MRTFRTVLFLYWVFPVLAMMLAGCGPANLLALAGGTGGGILGFGGEKRRMAAVQVVVHLTSGCSHFADP